MADLQAAQAVILLAIDPGPQASAYVLYGTETRTPLGFAKVANEDLRDRLAAGLGADLVAIEMIASYGLAVGAEVFDTCVWIGRFIEASFHGSSNGLRVRRVFRRDVKLHLCGTSRATDTNVRQVLIDRYGPGKAAAIGLKATPGPLYGIAGDCWSALAVAITAAEING